MQVVVVTPEKTTLDEKADSVTLPLYDGSIGILDNHAPMIGRMGFGQLEVKAGSSSQRYYVDGGFVQVADNVVSVLTGRAMPISEIDVNAAREALAAAEQMECRTAENSELKQRAISQAKAQIKLGGGS